MAASDPTMAVATPTGALQGVAAFSWDGSVWQPTGRAGSAVATPTGVLQGVGPFTWDGSAWQPSGRAGPGVATPTGVLDGVAVYTWSGSAWTPAGGQPTPSTPTGALRGIAAFSWDGTTWQPAAQAGPSVPTPTGVLQGVAIFNWNGTAWQPGGALPSGATLDLSFLTAGALDPRITFARASTATYFDSTGTMQTAAINAPRLDYDPVTHALRGLLIEEARTNQAQQSGHIDIVASWALAAATTTANATLAPDGTATATAVVPTTANAQHGIHGQPASTITAGAATSWSLFVKPAGYPRLQMTLASPGLASSVNMTFNVATGVAVGSIVYTGTASAGSAAITQVGNGWYRVSVTGIVDATSTAAHAWAFVDNGTTSTFAGDGVSGMYVWGGQMEAGAFPTSYIPTTAASVTRALEVCQMPTAAWYNSSTYSLMAEFISYRDCDVCGLSDTTFSANTSYLSVAGNSANFTWAGTGGGAASSTANVTSSAVNKACGTFSVPAARWICAANGTVGLPTNVTTTAQLATRLSLGTDPWSLSTAMNGYVRRVRYWPRALSNAELQSVTT